MNKGKASFYYREVFEYFLTEQKVFCPAGNGGEEKIETQKFEINKKEMKAPNELEINFNSCTLKIDKY